MTPVEIITEEIKCLTVESTWTYEHELIRQTQLETLKYILKRIKEEAHND